MTGMHGGAGDPCAEIDLILRDCLEASQLQGNSNCFEEPTPAESDMYGARRRILCGRARFDARVHL